MKSKVSQYGPYLVEADGSKVYRHDRSVNLNLARTGKRLEILAYRYEVYLEQEITTASNYSGLCDLLRNAQAVDEFTFYLANFGGDCHSLINLLNAVSKAEATVIMDVTSPCYSACATLALCGDELWLNEDTFLMFHNYSGGSHGKGKELLDSIGATDKWIKSYMRRLHQPFLSKQECDRIENDKDVYVHWNDKDLERRLKRHFK